jgi:hypothetical protein
LEAVTMNPRLVTIATLCREVALPASVLAWIAAFGSAGIYNIAAAPVVDRLAPFATADARFAGKLQPIAFSTADAAAAGKSIAEPDVAVADSRPVIKAADAVAVSRPVTGAVDAVAASKPVTAAATADALPASHEPGPIVTAALTAPSETLPPETPAEPVAKASMATPEPGDTHPAVGSTEVLDECFAVDTCVDRYLWALYQRTPKEDSVKVQQQRTVDVKRKGKLVTVTRTFTTVADEDFSWKDPKAAEHAGMPMADYVIGGMDRDFKLKLFHVLHAAEEAGLAPGITSAFRDNYRQSIASGLKAADDRSYHGGSSRGGYGHGLAADVVSVNGATRAQRLTSSETLWNWIDKHGKELGIGRPYLDRDPPHVAPIDGKEYADHHHGRKARQVASAAKPGSKPPLRDAGSPAKRTKLAKSSEG